jgi:hypothetical protein
MASDLDVRGAAIVGMGLAQAILSALKAKRLLSDEEVAELLDGVLVGLESLFPADDADAARARQLVELIVRGALRPPRGIR